MSLPQGTGGYGLGPGEGEALWFNRGLGLLNLQGTPTTRQTALWLQNEHGCNSVYCGDGELLRYPMRDRSKK